MSVAGGSMAGGGGGGGVDLLSLALLVGSDPDFRKRLQELSDAQKAAEKAQADLALGQTVKLAAEAVDKARTDFQAEIAQERERIVAAEAEATRKAVEIVAGAEAKAKALTERAEANAVTLTEKAEKLAAEAEADAKEAKATLAHSKAENKLLKSLKAELEAERTNCSETIHATNNERQKLQLIAGQLRTLLEKIEV
jgi:hypothetical protein